MNSEYEHDYGTICHALSAVAVQAARVMDRQSQGGITGFVMWEFIRNWMHIEGAASLVQYEHMLYPQYAGKFDKTISADIFKWLQEEAVKRLADSEYMHPNVVAHMESIVGGVVPFGYTIKD